MAEKMFVAGTEVVELLHLTLYRHKTVFRALAVAHGKYLTGSAQAWQGSSLGFAESSQPSRAEEFDERGFLDVADSPAGMDKMIAGIDVTIVFDHRNVAAGRAKEAEGVFLGKGDACCLLENLHLDGADIPGQPLVENRT